VENIKKKEKKQQNVLKIVNANEQNELDSNEIYNIKKNDLNIT
jgi:hypothetical protein